MFTRATPSIILTPTFEMNSGCGANGSQHSNKSDLLVWYIVLFDANDEFRHDFREQRRHPCHFPEIGMIYTYGRTAGHRSEDWEP